jgi:hypothetical protein
LSAHEKQQPGPAMQAEEAVAARTDGARAVPVAKRAAIYTMTAREGLDVAEMVNAAFKAKKPIGKRTPYRPEIVEPDGPSTSGGKRARQTIRLVATGSGNGPIMIGYLDVAQKVAELRTHDAVAEQYADRFGEPFDVTREEYATLMRDLEGTLSPFQYNFGYAEESRAARMPRAEKPAPKTPVLNLVLLSVAVIVAAAAAIALLR